MLTIGERNGRGRDSILPAAAISKQLDYRLRYLPKSNLNPMPYKTMGEVQSGVNKSSAADPPDEYLKTIEDDKAYAKDANRRAAGILAGIAALVLILYISSKED